MTRITLIFTNQFLADRFRLKKSTKLKYNKLIVIITLLPTLVFANAGSPMMWFGMLHSLFLNFIIGFFESKYLEQRKIQNKMWVIILGNYFSMIIGLNYIAPYFSSLSGNLDFWGGNTNFGEYDLTGFIIGMLASFVATLFLELPFYFFSVKEKINWKKGAFKFLEVNTISNLIMFSIYYYIVFEGSK